MAIYVVSLLTIARIGGRQKQLKASQLYRDRLAKVF